MSAYISFHFMKKIEGDLFTRSSVDSHKCIKGIKDGGGLFFCFIVKVSILGALVLLSSAISLFVAPVSAMMGEAAPVCVAVWTVPHYDLGSN